jgi:hypothetical protein
MERLPAPWRGLQKRVYKFLVSAKDIIALMLLALQTGFQHLALCLKAHKML